MENKKELLTKAGYDFIIDPASVDEEIDVNKTPYENVLDLGLKKALADKEKYPNDILLGCDTIVVYNGVIYGKPKDEIDAYNTLKKLSGNSHYVMSGVGIVYKDIVHNFVVTSKVVFKELSDKGIIVHILNMGIVDSKSPTGTLVLTVLTAFAQYERDCIVERMREGKAIARQDVNYREGRPQIHKDKQKAHALELLNSGKTYKQVEELTGMSKSTLIRYKRKIEAERVAKECVNIAQNQ